MIEVPEKYALEVSSPAPITSARQHEQYLAVLDKLATRVNPTSDEEKYAAVLLTLIEAYEEEHLPFPMRPPLKSTYIVSSRPPHNPHRITSLRKP